MVTKANLGSFVLMLCLSITACRSSNKSASTAPEQNPASPASTKEEVKSYEFNQDQADSKSPGCTTGKKSAKSLEELCSSLVDEKQNGNGCAKKERADLYIKSGCAQVPSVLPTAGVMTCEARVKDSKKAYQLKVDGINNKLSFVGEVPAKMPKIIYSEAKMIEDRPLSSGPLQQSCSKAISVTKDDVTQTVICKSEVVDGKDRNLLDIITLVYQFNTQAEGVISLTHQCDDSGFEIALKNCK